MLKEASLHNYTVICAIATSPDELPDAVRDDNVDGLILAGNRPSPEMLSALKKFPAVWLTSHSSPSDTILTGNDRIAQMAISYLNSRNRRNLAFVNAVSGIAALAARRDFFHFFAGRCNLECAILESAEEAIPLNGDTPDLERLEEELTQLAAKLCQLPTRPDGIFVPMDFQLALFYRVIVRHGLTPGKDFDCIGCDGEIMTLAGLFPRPATIDIPGESLGRCAVEQLLLQISLPKRSWQRGALMIEPRLIPGD
ncbi:MAG: substrate-binding domain-containing protein [Victivallaceae bacterium]|nr:substrate-binding domain-containing protein [Victivallaceae bacterium]